MNKLSIFAASAIIASMAFGQEADPGKQDAPEAKGVQSVLEEINQETSPIVSNGYDWIWQDRSFCSEKLYLMNKKNKYLVSNLDFNAQAAFVEGCWHHYYYQHVWWFEMQSHDTYVVNATSTRADWNNKYTDTSYRYFKILEE